MSFLAKKPFKPINNHRKKDAAFDADHWRPCFAGNILNLKKPNANKNSAPKSPTLEIGRNDRS
ncbi:MAG: hypothetical protein QNJ27_00415, partial [Simkaniaceae bacterium]|nr:hypothetical protein [Simkaniaceae bacterium]